MINDAHRVSLDSQCLSYLLDGITGIIEPTDSLAEERKALLRTWFYRPGTFVLTETVMNEVANIRNIERRKSHQDFVLPMFHDDSVRNPSFVAKRAIEFESLHPKKNDCRILAEAEDAEVDIVLTYDDKFLKMLGTASNKCRLERPTLYWLSLDIPRGATADKVPHYTNPLFQHTWWRW